MIVKPNSGERKLNLANELNGIHITHNSTAEACEGVSMSLARALIMAPILCLIAACGSASGTGSDNTAAPAPVTTSGTTVAAVADPTAFKLGANLASINYWDGSRPFMNLIYGSGWQMAGSGAAEDVPLANLDANGWVKSVPAGDRVMRMLSIPTTTGDFVCRYQGNGQLTVTGPVSNVSYAAGETRFTYTSSYPAVTWAFLQYNVDPSNYIRNIDCREVSASTTSAFSPDMLNNLNGFKVIRFIKWQPAVEANTPVTWATRNKPGDGDYFRNDGVPVEVMVDFANQASANAWFNIPWNADDDYITRFATYVRDNLAPDKQVYVETSNEVWNWVYPVTTQAANEGAAEGLPSAVGGKLQQLLGRYAEKTQHVMQIWSSVFAGQNSRLVRVASFQNVQPFWVDYIMGYNGTANSVDAIATAPYFGINVDSEYPGATADQLFATAIPAAISSTLNYAAQNKALAVKYGKRYVAYEGGQHILTSNLALLQQVERDPRMYDAYKTYLTGWKAQGGDTMNMFALVGPISQYGAWGLTEYFGQPLTQAPKLRAVRDFLGVATASTDTTIPPPPPTAATQVCPDGTVILSTSTCPIPTTSPSAKRRGKSTRQA
jgi:hypothetical protein